VNRTTKLKVGDWVEVRSRKEILGTLDSKGQLEGMPFMPEMFAFCGKRFRVYKRAHKTCDTVFPIRGRRVKQAVHLETRCDGTAHGGCQAGCLIFWKEAWLQPVKPDADKNLDCGEAGTFVSLESTPGNGNGNGPHCAEADVATAAQLSGPEDGVVRYICQATQLPYATSDLSPWDIRQYIEDYVSGNVTLAQLLQGLIYSSYCNLIQAGVGLGPPMRWLYDRVSWLWRGSRFPRTEGCIPVGSPTPAAGLNLQAGELVRVKSHEEILATITTHNKNRGMTWDAEMVPYCGGTYRVLKRVTQIIDEKTGKMQTMKNPCIILEHVVCQARYSGCRMFCPRSIYPYWREIWLERVKPDTSSTGSDQQPLAAVSRPCGTDAAVNGDSHGSGLVEIEKGQVL
jgi:hypothetical protein